VTEQRPDQSEPSSEGLLDAAVTGARWLAIARVCSDSVQFFAAVLLARHIIPAEFGHAAIALILVPLSAILTFEGFASALVQRKEISRRHIEAASLASVVAGIGLTVLTWFGAPLVAEPIFGARTTELIQLASPLYLIAGISAVPRSLLWRRLEFRAVSLVETASLVLGSIVSVVLAFTGSSGEAIVIGALCGQATATVLMVFLAPPARPRLHRSELRDILTFGAPASGAGLLYVAITNVDYTILAARLSAAQVGIYWRAFQLGVVYQDKISGIVMRLSFPVYSRTRDMTQLTKLHERATRVHAAVVCPILAIGIVVMPALVPWLFGGAWRPAVPVAQILCIAGMVAAVLTGFAQLMLAAGHPRALFRFNIAVLLVYGVTVWLTAKQGLTVVAGAVVGVYLLQLLGVYGILFRRVVGIPVGRMVSDLSPAVVGSAAIMAIGIPLESVLRSAPAPFAVALLAGIGFVIHVTVLRNFFPAVWNDLSGLVRRLVPMRLQPRRWRIVPSTSTS
jgi:teichuronic acid exporter